MKYILILLISSFAYGQVPQPLAGIEGFWSIVNGDSTFIFNGDTGENPNYAKRMWRNFYNKTPITMGMVFDYAEECYNDTVKATLFEGEYIVQFKGEGFSWMLTERQLEKRGYYYSYRWITNAVIDEDNPMDFEYIFIGKPTLKGFIEWLKKT